jgi:uracil-DNA glycosylase
MSKALDYLQKFVDRSYLVEPELREVFLSLGEKVFEPIKKDIEEGKVVYPAQEDVFKCFRLCPLNSVRVVILGQDPYHSPVTSGLPFPCVANGLAFDVNVTQTVPPSLKAIISKMEDELGGKLNADVSYLGHLPSMGVLLMNTAFTVVMSNPGSHLKIWKGFTESVVRTVAKREHVVWLLWGNHAKSFKPLIPKSHTIIEGVHPSPLAGGLFKNASYFTTTNTALISRGYQPINFLNANANADS